MFYPTLYLDSTPTTRRNIYIVSLEKESFRSEGYCNIECRVSWCFSPYSWTLVLTLVEVTLNSNNTCLHEAKPWIIQSVLNYGPFTMKSKRICNANTKSGGRIFIGSVHNDLQTLMLTLACKLQTSMFMLTRFERITPLGKLELTKEEYKNRLI